MLRKNVYRSGLVALLCLFSSAMALADEPFRLKSPIFEDNGIMPRKFGGVSSANKNCIGENVSVPLTWSRGPAGTKSYVLMMVDLAGRGGTGVDHWLIYGIPADVTTLKEGEHSQPHPKYLGGRSAADTDQYFGPCPAPGSGLHHYVFTLVATDLEPDALKAGLNRTDLMKAITGRAKAVTDMVLRQEYGL